MMRSISRCIHGDKATESSEEEENDEELQDWYMVWEYDETQTSSDDDHHIVFSSWPRPIRAHENAMSARESTLSTITSNIKITGKGRLMGKVGADAGVPAKGELAPRLPPDADDDAAVRTMKTMYLVRPVEPVTVLTLDLRITGRLQSKSMVQVHGWCHDRNSRTLSLVAESMPNGSLHSHLHPADPDGAPTLPWDVRYRIARDLARAILYLHDEFELRAIHADITSRDVLLGAGFDAKLTNFGALRLVSDEVEAEALVLGTSMGNPSAERPVREPLGKEANVRSFGNVALEIASGLDPARLSRGGSSDIWRRAMESYAKDVLLDAVDRRLDAFDPREAETLLLVGLLCAQPEPRARPAMRQVARYLAFEDPVLPRLPSAAISSFLGTGSYQQAGCSYSERPLVLRARTDARELPPAAAAAAAAPGPLTEFQRQIVKGAAADMRRSLEKEVMSLERAVDITSRYTQVLVAMGIPTDAWSRLVQEVLSVARAVDGFREEVGDPGYDPRGRDLAGAREEVKRRSREVEMGEEERAALVRRRDALRVRAKEVDEEMRGVTRVMKAVMAREGREVAERERRMREYRVLETARSVLSKVSSFACEV